MAGNNNKIVWGIVGVTGLALIGVVAAWHFLMPAKANAKTASTPTPEKDKKNVGGIGGGSSTKTTTYASGYPLKIGSRGANVSALQQALSDLGASLQIDGIFGTITQGALIQATGLATVDSPSALQNIVNQGNTMASTPNFQGNMLANPNYVAPTPASCADFFNQIESGN